MEADVLHGIFLIAFIGEAHIPEGDVETGRDVLPAIGENRRVAQFIHPIHTFLFLQPLSQELIDAHKLDAEEGAEEQKKEEHLKAQIPLPVKPDADGDYYHKGGGDRRLIESEGEGRLFVPFHQAIPPRDRVPLGFLEGFGRLVESLDNFYPLGVLDDSGVDLGLGG